MCVLKSKKGLSSLGVKSRARSIVSYENVFQPRSFQFELSSMSLFTSFFTCHVFRVCVCVCEREIAVIGRESFFG